MKCIKCKYNDKNKSICTYPFKITAKGDLVIDEEGKIIGCSHGKKK